MQRLTPHSALVKRCVTVILCAGLLTGVGFQPARAEEPSAVRVGPRSDSPAPRSTIERRSTAPITRDRVEGSSADDRGGQIRFERQVPSARRISPDTRVRVNDLRDADARRLRPYRVDPFEHGSASSRFARDIRYQQRQRDRNWDRDWDRRWAWDRGSDRFYDHRGDPFRFGYRSAWPYRSQYYFYSGQPVVILDDYETMDTVIVSNGASATYRGGDASGSAGGDAERKWVEGHWAEMPTEEAIEGETVAVFYPAVFRETEDGKREQLEAEKTVREPKCRIVLRRMWVHGHYVDAQGEPLEPVTVSDEPPEDEAN